MKPELEGVMTIKNEVGELVGVVFNDTKKRSQVFYTCKEMGAEDIKSLLENFNNDKSTLFHPKEVK